MTSELQYKFLNTSNNKLTNKICPGNAVEDSGLPRIMQWECTIKDLTVDFSSTLLPFLRL